MHTAILLSMVDSFVFCRKDTAPRCQNPAAERKVKKIFMP
jgi:hypothetical protein